MLTDEPPEAKVETVGGLSDNGALDKMLLEDPTDTTQREARAGLTQALVKPPETPVG